MATLLLFGLLAAFAALCLGVVTVRTTLNVSGLVTASGVDTVSDNEGIVAAPASVLAAQPATLTTHTDSTHGTLTMTNTSHGIITGQRLDLYWTGGQCYNVTAGTVAGTSVPITVTGGGSNLPAASTAVTVGIPVQTAFNVTGNNLSALVCSTPQTGYFCFDASTTDDFAILVQAGDCYVYSTASGHVNPLATYTITSVWMSHNYVTAPVTNMQAAAATH